MIKGLKFIGGFFGVFLFISGIYALYGTVNFQMRGTKISGKIVAMKERSTATKVKYNKKLEYSPTIEYLKDGQIKTFQSKTYFKHGKFSIGQSVDMIISEHYPFESLNTFKALWLQPLLLTGLGLVLAIILFKKR